MSHQTPKQKRKNNGFKILFSAYITVGFLLIAFASYIKLQKQRELFNIDNSQVLVGQDNADLPVRLIVGESDLVVEVKEGSVNNGRWDISDRYALHLANSKNPGDGGNIVIYAHNRKKLFGPLVSDVIKGQTVKLVNKKSEVSYYNVKDILTVDPYYTEVIKDTDYEVLTLFTCTGILDGKRLVIRAFPTELSANNP